MSDPQGLSNIGIIQNMGPKLTDIKNKIIAILRYLLSPPQGDILTTRRLKTKDEHDLKIIADIEKFGWNIMNVSDPEGKLPNFSYSIGMFYSLKSPEIIVYGLGSDDATRLLNNIGDYIKEKGTIKPLIPYNNFLDKSRICTFIDVEKSKYREHFGFDIWFYGSYNFPALQCVWSDEKKRFPWDKEFDPNLKHLQLILGKAPI